jgi:hypothetical protein
MRWLNQSIPALFLGLGALAALPTATAIAADYVVYSVFKPIDLGNPGEAPQKDYYVNMGSAQGVRPGSQLEVLRRISTYDLLNQKLYKDVTFPIARLKVIHVENNAAICRLDKLLPVDKTPEPGVRAVMVGDIVQPVN